MKWSHYLAIDRHNTQKLFPERVPTTRISVISISFQLNRRPYLPCLVAACMNRERRVFCSFNLMPQAYYIVCVKLFSERASE
jgi:hypothetical protein